MHILHVVFARIGDSSPYVSLALFLFYIGVFTVHKHVQANASGVKPELCHVGRDAH